jgi:hypothetical protein
VTSYTEGSSHFVTSMTAPVASGWSGCRVGLAPTGKRRLGTARRVKSPASDLVDRLDLGGAPRAPERYADALVEHPTHSEMEDPLAKPRMRQLVQPIHGREILVKPRLLEFRVRAAKIVALECRVRPHPTR